MFRNTVIAAARAGLGAVLPPARLRTILNAAASDMAVTAAFVEALLSRAGGSRTTSAGDPKSADGDLSARLPTVALSMLAGAAASSDRIGVAGWCCACYFCAVCVCVCVCVCTPSYVGAGLWKLSDSATRR